MNWEIKYFLKVKPTQSGHYKQDAVSGKVNANWKFAAFCIRKLSSVRRWLQLHYCLVHHILIEGAHFSNALQFILSGQHVGDDPSFVRRHSILFQTISMEYAVSLKLQTSMALIFVYWQRKQHWLQWWQKMFPLKYSESFVCGHATRFTCEMLFL